MVAGSDDLVSNAGWDLTVICTQSFARPVPISNSGKDVPTLRWRSQQLSWRRMLLVSTYFSVSSSARGARLSYFLPPIWRTLPMLILLDLII